MPRRPPPPTLLDQLIDRIAIAVENSGIADAIDDFLQNTLPPPQNRRVEGQSAPRGRSTTPRRPTRPTSSQRAPRKAPVPPTPATTLYDVLQVSPHASVEVIQGAYRSLSRVYHPDIPGTGNEDRFKALAAAYAILSNPKERKTYDASLHLRRR